MPKTPAEIEGRGGGFGSYKGLTLVEIQTIFDDCLTDPSMRSISAILRITREQVEARGHLGLYPLLAWVALAICGGALFARQFLEGRLLADANLVAIGSFASFLILLVSIIPTRNDRKINREQKKIIEQAATDAISQVLTHDVNLQPLTYEQEVTVKILMKRTVNAEKIRALLS